MTCRPQRAQPRCWGGGHSKTKLLTSGLLSARSPGRNAYQVASTPSTGSHRRAMSAAAKSYCMGWSGSRPSSTTTRRPSGAGPSQTRRCTTGARPKVLGRSHSVTQSCMRGAANGSVALSIALASTTTSGESRNDDHGAARQAPPPGARPGRRTDGAIRAAGPARAGVGDEEDPLPRVEDRAANGPVRRGRVRRAIILAIAFGPPPTPSTPTAAPAAAASPAPAPAAAAAPAAPVAPPAGVASPALAPATPAPAAPTGFAAPPVTSTDPVDPNASPAAQARQGCQAFENGVAPVLLDAVSSGDLAPALRVQMGLPADVNDPSGVSLSAPFVVANSALGDAGAGDATYQPIDDALNALSDTIEHATPGGDLTAIATGTDLVTTRCQRLSDPHRLFNVASPEWRRTHRRSASGWS